MNTLSYPADPNSGANAHRHRLQVVLLLASAAVLSLLLIFAEPLAAMPLQGLCAAASACSIVLAAIVFIGSDRGVWSAPFSYVAVYWVFHFGLIFSSAVGAQLIEEETRWLHQWFFRRLTHTAIVLSCAGLAACVAGVCLAGVLRAGRVERESETRDDPPFRSILTRAGFSCLSLSIFGWLVIGLMSGGPGIFIGDYMSWLAATARTPIIWVYYGIGIGMALLAVGGAHSLRRWGFVVFGLWSLVAFPLGLRGEVLFPLTTALVVMARRRAPMSTATVVVSAVFLLFAIAIVRDLRHEGIGRAKTSAMKGNPLSALGELGGSLRPVVEVLTWHDLGEDYLYGASYWAPVERAITAVVPIATRPPADQDDRIMNVLVQRRIGPIGFSVVAEAHRNFGGVGVIIIMLLLGLLLGWMESWPATPGRGAVLGVVFVELLFHVRNDFVAVPVHVVLGLCLVVFLRFLAHYRPRHLASAPAAFVPVNSAAAPGPEANAPRRGGWGRRRVSSVPGDEPPSGAA